MPTRDVYHCPGGQELRFRKHKYTERTRVYQAPAAACNACPLKAQCTTSAKGRQVKRSFDEAYLERVRGYHATEPYAKAMRKRQVWVEPLFAEAKDWHGLRRFRLRGLEKVNIEALLIAAGQNLKRLLSPGGGDGARSRVALPASSCRCSYSHRPCPHNRSARTRVDGDTTPRRLSPFSTGRPLIGTTLPHFPLDSVGVRFHIMEEIPGYRNHFF